MTHEELMKHALDLGMLEEDLLMSLGPRGGDLYEMIGHLAGFAYTAGLAERDVPDFKINHIDDEYTEYFVGDTQVAVVSYEEHGSFAMRTMEATFLKIAEALGMERVDA